MANSNPIKPGWKTSEFYVTVLAGIIAAFLADKGIVIPEAALATVLLPIILYIYGRSKVKAEQIP